MGDYEGRLELTWTNKSKRLLAAEDGSDEWVDPADYRVAEVRLLDDIATMGEVGPDRAADNLLIRGGALNALRSLARLPEFAAQYLGKVKLAYLDPPFNTQQSFLHADDRVTVNWDYLIVSESDIDIAKGSWAALLRLGAG